MFELEPLANKSSSSTLLDKVDPKDPVNEELLNSPFEDEKSDENEITSSLKNQDIPSEEELNRPIEKGDVVDTPDLSIADKADLHVATGWSYDIIDSIKTMDEALVYKEAGLKDVGGNLERTDIDWNVNIPQEIIDRMRSLYGDEVADRWAGKTNMDLIKEGKAPYGTDNKRINLHHIGQKADSPLAELTDTEHKVNDGILHDKTKTSEIERPVFRQEREAYWRNRYEELNK